MAYTATSPDDIEALRSYVAAVDPASNPAGSCLNTWDLARNPCDSAFGLFFTCSLFYSDSSPAAPLYRVTAAALPGPSRAQSRAISHLAAPSPASISDPTTS
uniref:Uncharacterized protein n=1 Tax=Ananas comosus var. bracteatus TaxID=296719 RepID=A0A6V7QB69_ANACO|nr:unnamed protein product [Ananas comosus var. bracteatus]